MAFDNVLFNANYSIGAQGGKGFLTNINVLAAGDEKRQAEWEDARGEWVVNLPAMSKSDMETETGFFYGRRGMHRGFLFKDWSDYTLARQSIGTGDGADLTWQVFKSYDTATNQYDYNLYKLVSGTVQVWVNSVLLTETTDYTVGYNTGIITFVSASPVVPASGHNIEVACQFYVPVRFDIDRPNIIMLNSSLMEWPGIKMVEIRDIA